MNKKGIFCGDIGIDIILEIQKHPQPEQRQDSAVRNVHTLPGGSAANSAVVASHIQVDSYYMGLIGNDNYRNLLFDDLKRHGVKLDLVKEAEGNNTLITVISEEDQELKFYSFRGVNGFIEYGAIPEGLTEDYDCVHISGYCMQNTASRDHALALIRDARQTNTLLSFAPSILFSCSNEIKKGDFLANFDIVIPNLEMAQCLTDQKYVVDVAKTLRQMGPKIVVIKMGRDGCYLSFEDKEQHIPALPVENVINNLGAGDAFCGGFIAAYMNGMKLEDAAKVGNAAASITIQGYGRHDSVPSYEKIKEVLPDMELP